MQDPEFRAAVEELEPAYEVIRMRAVLGLTQEELALRVGTTQSSIARLESGRQQPSLSFLRRVAEALGARLEVSLVPREERRKAAGAVEAMAEQGAFWSERAVAVYGWPVPQASRVVMPTISTASDTGRVTWEPSR